MYSNLLTKEELQVSNPARQRTTLTAFKTQSALRGKDKGKGKRGIGMRMEIRTGIRAEMGSVRVKSKKEQKELPKEPASCITYQNIPHEDIRL